MLLTIGILAFLAGLSGLLYMRLNPHFGGKISKEDKFRYEKSENWKNGKFENLLPTNMEIDIGSLPGILKKQFFERKGRMPVNPIPIEPFKQEEFYGIASSSFIWYGHSVLLIRISGLNFLVDPMFGNDASPIAPFSAERFSKDTLNIIHSLPPIDAILISHDHYDHLDYPSIKKLKDKTDTFLVSLGVSRHLEAWGIEKEKITEFDWWDTETVKGIKITFTPSRHFSGRGLSDRAKVLWGGWVFDNGEERIFFSGDGGYGPHFKEIGDKLGPFSVGFMECGQYNENWHLIHMYPEEAVQASLDSRVNVAVPVHWGGFALSLHTWKDPVTRFAKEANIKGIKYLTPKPGQAFNDQSIASSWWKDLE